MRKTTLLTLLVGAILALTLAACGGQQTPPQQTVQTSQEEHLEDEEDHGGEDHGVSDTDAIQENPIARTEESIGKGARIYADNCAACHGDAGLGDGAAGASLTPPPANLHEDHVQALSDGGMFAIIHNGVADTAMPAFGQTLDEDDIWHVVNYIRTYRQE